MMDKLFMERHGYTFKSHLGEGTFGKVVKAHSVHRKKLVALKLIDTKKVSSDYKDKFLPHERQIIKSLDHSNIVKTLEIFESRTGMVYVVMELCTNGDLLKYITAKGGLAEYSSCTFFRQLCMAFQYLHDMEVAHRDLKCENLLLDTYYNIKVCDFGFSKMLTYVDGKMVLSQTFCGTKTYAAPEVLRNLPYNPKVSDVWSMGVVLYMMLYATLPFQDSNIIKMVKMQMENNINFPQTPHVSSEAKELIHRILQPDMQQRITISNMLQSVWMLQEGIMQESDEASASNTDSKQLSDKKIKENGQPSEEGTSAAGPRH